MPVAVVAGHVCVDLFPSLASTPSALPGLLLEVGPLRLAPGGCVAGTGLALAELGVTTRLVADIGDDTLGDVLAATLTRQGVCTSGLVRRPGGSTSYSIVVEPAGADRTFWHHVGANEAFDGAEVDLDGAALLHLGYPSLLPALCADGGAAWESLLQRARSRGMTTSLDLATMDPGSDVAHLDWTALLRRVLPLTDVVTPSSDDVAGALGIPGPGDPDAALAVARQLLAMGAAVVMLTAGASGLLLLTGSVERLLDAGSVLAPQAERWADRALWVPAMDIPLVTTTGAGDAATAGLLQALLAGETPEGAALCAARTAGARIGSRPLTATADLFPRMTTAPAGWLPAEAGVLHAPQSPSPVPVPAAVPRQESPC